MPTEHRVEILCFYMLYQLQDWIGCDFWVELTLQKSLTNRWVRTENIIGPWRVWINTDSTLYAGHLHFEMQLLDFSSAQVEIVQCKNFLATNVCRLAIDTLGAPRNSDEQHALQRLLFDLTHWYLVVGRFTVLQKFGTMKQKQRKLQSSQLKNT